jgi:hypothetical protein
MYLSWLIYNLLLYKFDTFNTGLVLCVGNQQNRTGRCLNRQNSQLRGELTTPQYTRHIYRCSAALRWCIVKKTNGEHNRESSLLSKFV